MKKSRKLLAFVIAFVMVLALVPSMAFAVTGDGLPTASDFGEGVLFTASNAGGDFRNLDADRSVLTDGGNVFEIRVTNTETGDTFKSFCAGATSTGLAGDGGSGQYCTGYFKADVYELGGGNANFDKLIGALNYVNNTLGTIDMWSNDAGYNFYITAQATRIVSQVLVWNLVCGVDINVMLDGTNLKAWTNAGYHGPQILDALANTDATGDIVGFALLNCTNDVDGSHNNSCQRQLVPIYKEDPPITPSGSLDIDKTVDGIDFVDWVLDNYNDDPYVLMDDITFDLYKVASKGEVVGPGAVSLKTVTLTSSGIDFGSFNPVLEDGWYAVVETLGPIASQVFENIGTKYFYISYVDEDYVVSGDQFAFDYSAFYTIINGYGSGYTLGYPGLNNTGDIFPIAVKNAATPAVYPSFCANAGSTHFAGESGEGCGGYMVTFTEFPTGATNLDDFISALNYIEDTYGNLNDNRALTQVVIWALLDAIDVNSSAFNAIDAWKVDKAAAKDVMANYEGYVGKGTIADVVFMVCEHHHSYITCQPQLVPVYAGDKFNNKPTDPMNFSAQPAFSKFIKTGEDDFDYIWPEDVQFTFILERYNFVSGEYDDFVCECTNDDTGEVLGPDLEYDANNSYNNMYRFIEKEESGWIPVNYKDGIFFELVLFGDQAKVSWMNLNENLYDETRPIMFNKEEEALGKLVVTANVKAKEEYFKTKTISDTLTTYVGDPKLTDKKANGGYVGADYIDNVNGGFTAVALKVGNPGSARTFDISYSGHGNPKFQEPKDKIGIQYEAQVVGGNVVVKLNDEKFVSGSIAWGVYKSPSELDAIKWAPGKYQSGGHKTYQAGATITIPLPKGYKDGDTVYLAIHCASMTFETKETAWKDVPYRGTLNLTVTGPDEDVVYNGTIANGGTWTSGDLAAGEYTCVLTGDGFLAQTKTATVVADQTITVSFSGITVEYKL